MSHFRVSWLIAMSGAAGVIEAAELPIPCIAGSCGAAIPGFVSAGQAHAVQAGNLLTIEQLTDNATLNWQSFNISADGTVTFKQPDAGSVALNRIFQADPSRIFGSLTANGRIFLVNQNGIVFGEGAQVNASGLIASSLDITPEALTRGIAQAVDQNAPAFRAFTDIDGNAVGGEVRVERGATITSTGGQVLLFAPGNVENRGTIRTPDGQTILAAGEQVFLAASTDPSLRGLLVEVGPGGTVTNGTTGVGAGTTPEQLVGQIIAERGNITLAGLAVNQFGRVSATTSVRANGTIRLLARDQAQVAVSAGGTNELQATRGGTLTLGTASRTDVTLDFADTATAVDATAQPRSQVRLDGHAVNVLAGSRITANAGTIDVTARASPAVEPAGFTAQSDGSRIFLADDVVLDVSGARIALPVERNVLRVELRGNQLRDSPAQRDGALRGQAVHVDVRRTGTRADGSTWVGTPLADLAGDVSTIARGVGERNLNGGAIRLQSQGDVLVSGGARLDVSGGRIDYADGFVNTSRLVAADGSSVDIARADPARAYRGVLDASQQVNRRWGITENYFVNGLGARGTFEPGYVEGKDAGSVTMSAPQMIFDGAILGETVRGTHQRAPAAVLTAGLSRPYDQVPLGAALSVGNATPLVSELPDNVVGGIRIESGSLLGSLRSALGGVFDPLTDALSNSFDVFRLRPEVLGPGAVTRLSLFANDVIELPVGQQIDLGQGGSLNATAGRVLIEGEVRLPGGFAVLEARPSATTAPGDVQLTLGTSARIAAHGSWVNDNALLVGGGRDALYTSGGSVSLAARQGQLTLQSGSSIDVSGGAQRRSDGRIVPGRGGTLSLTTTPTVDGIGFTPRIDAEIRAYSFGQGGQLSIAAPSLCIAATDCAGDEPGLLWLATDLFSQRGFADFRLSSNLGGISVLPGTLIDVAQMNRLPLADLASLGSALDAAPAARLGALPTHERFATSLSLNSQVAALSSPFTRAQFADAPALDIGRGALIQTQLGGAISLNTNTRVSVDGALVAPAGRIDIGLDAGLLIQEFLPSQAIWLGDHARLSAAGAARVSVDARGYRRGEVLPGGTVSINARRGYLLAAPGASVDVSGASATLDLRNAAAGVVTYLPRDVGSAGGRVALTAAEGIAWSARLSAAGGSDAVAGGHLSVTLDSSLRNDPGILEPVFPVGPRRIELSESVAPISIGAGGAVPAALNGRAQLGADFLAGAGLDSLALAASDLYATNTFRHFGEIWFDDVSLDLRRSLSVDAALITGRGDSRVTAPYVAFAHSDVASQRTPESFADGRATFDVAAEHIDLTGAISFDGFSSVRLASRGDLRLRGVQLPEARRFSGSLTTNADLTIDALQVFPATLTDFEMRVRGNSEGTLRINRSSAGVAAPVLSVGGRLTLNAPTVLQGGTLRAPLGGITLTGADVVLQTGSVTSTSLAGNVALFGSTQAGLDWVYELPDRQSLVFDDQASALPAQRIELDGVRVSVDAGAVVDLSGGGDLMAWEFVPGVDGSRDLLSRAERPNQFAILPGLGTSFGPWDAREFQGTTLQPGDAVYLSGADGLPAGTYTLLPARFGLLPGAYLVSAVSGYQDINAGERFARLDGSTIVSGYRTFASTGVGDSRTSGFALRPGTAIRAEARYDLTTANDFFSTRARAEETAVPRLPFDAGQLVLAGIERLNLRGDLRSGAATRGRGAEVDIAGAALRIVADASAEPVDPTALLIDAGDLSRLGAESVLLGGVRRRTGEGSLIDVVAEDVSVERGAMLSAPEVTLAARARVAVADGATIESRGSIAARTDEALQVTGDGALLRVSSGESTRFERADELGFTGVLALEEGARIRSGGSLLLDASADTRSAATLEVAGASLQFGARRITLSAATLDDAGADAGLVLDPSQLSSLGLRELALTSRSTIDVAGGTSLAVRGLRLDAAGIGRAEGAGGDARLTADTITFANGSGVMAAARGAPFGTLALEATTLRVGDGRFDIFDFATTNLTARGGWLGAGAGAFAAAGDLNIFTPVLAQASAVDGAISATGALTLANVPGATAQEMGGIGGGLTLTGRSVHIDTTLDLPSGRLDVVGLGLPQGNGGSAGITLGSNARLQLAGRVRDFDGSVVGSPGGRVLLDARHGDLRMNAGSSIDVSGAGEAAAGRVSVRVPEGVAQLSGTLFGNAAAGARGGEFLIDALTLPSLDSLNAMLNGGGFTALRSLRQRGPGDLVVGAAAPLRAHEVELFADAGSVSILGLVDAAEAPGGRVSIGALGNLTIAGGIETTSGGTAGTKARIDLRSENGRIVFGTGSTVRAPGGAIHVSLPRSAVLSLADANPANDALRLGGTTVADSITVEGFQRYDAPADGFLTGEHTVAGESNPWFADASTFMQSAAAVRAGAGRANDASFRVIPGLEIVAPGDLTLLENWNLFNWRFDGAPGVLTLRAGGDLRFAASLSDGFASAAGNAAFALPAVASPSWTYRLAAGADLAGIDPLAVRSLTQLGESGGSLVIEPGTPSPSPTGVANYRLVRTGTGSIDVATGRDFVLGNAASVLYTAGTAGPGIPITTRGGGLGGRTYPIDGGDVSIRAGQDIVGAPNNQLVTDWLWRSGRPATLTNPSATAWTINFGRFMQGIGALAGGRVAVSAGRDVRDLSANVPHIGRQVGGTTPALSNVEIIGGGSLTVDAGRNIVDGKYFVGSGSLRLRAGDSMITDETMPETAVGSLIALGDAEVSAIARRDLLVGAIVNPTLLPQGLSQQPVTATRSVFTTYDAGSAVRLFATSGELSLSNDTGRLAQQLTSMTFEPGGDVSLRIYPPSLSAVAFDGDAVLQGSLSLYPDAAGRFELLANQNVLTRGTSAVEVLMSNADPLRMPRVAAPQADFGIVAARLTSGINISPDFNAPIPVHRGGDGIAHVVARLGDIAIESGGAEDSSGFYFPMPARLSAGRDVRDVSLTVVHPDDTDTSTVTAGRDVAYTVQRGERGGITRSLREIVVDGGGRLEIVAGRDVDLQTSSGITTRGDVVAQGVAQSGADVSIIAGLAGRAPQWQTFSDRYLRDGSFYDTRLIAFVETETGTRPAGKPAALLALAALPTTRRNALLEEIFFSELRTTGRIAAPLGPRGDFARAYTALETLFPGSNPDLATGQKNAYAGDIKLYFSRVYTLDGGDISLLAPGGGVNAGLATPPVAFGIDKSPSQLGIVVQSTGDVAIASFGDVQVNESRVFAADGGDILIWATRGDIDAGRGAKTAISAPLPSITFDSNGRPTIVFPAALTGSGIQSLATSAGRTPGDVDLFAPRGVVNAGDAGIVAGNLTIAATAVLGANNIKVSGVSVGVPVDAGGLAAGLLGVSNVAASSSNAASATVERGADQEKAAPLASAALGWLEVFVEGFGDDNCKPDDAECLARQRGKNL